MSETKIVPPPVIIQLKEGVSLHVDRSFHLAVDRAPEVLRDLMIARAQNNAEARASLIRQGVMAMHAKGDGDGLAGLLNALDLSEWKEDDACAVFEKIIEHAPDNELLEMVSIVTYTLAYQEYDTAADAVDAPAGEAS